jgi:hypothetical protein
MFLSRLISNAAVGGLLAAASPGLMLGQPTFIPQANEYPVVALRGDQVHPQLGLTPTNGIVVWEDNITDGQGEGISAQWLSSSFSPVLSPFRVNVTATGDQERPRVATLRNGGTAFVWQGGKHSSQHIYARFLSSSNLWLSTNDIQVNALTNVFQINPALAVLTNGNVVVAYGSFNQAISNSMQDVYAQILSPTGQKVGGEFLVNQFKTYNQRTPSIAGLSDGRFVVTWVSEQQTGDNAVDIFARIYSATGAAAGNEFLVDSTTNVCANPTVAAGRSGNFVITWGQKDLAVRTNGWDVFARAYTSAGNGGPVQPINTFIFGDQYAPKISSLANGFMIVWTSVGQDGSWEGLYARYLDSSGNVSGGEFVVNTTKAGRQLHPAVASDGVGRFLVSWSSFGGAAFGMDLYGQRFVDVSQPLPPMNAPFVWVPFVITGGTYQPRIQVSWPVQTGFPVDHYELFVDGGAVPINLTTNVWLMTAANGLAANTTHSFQVDFVTTTSRRSPLSPAASATTWMGYSWYGSVPFEWMASYYGYDTSTWPLPNSTVAPGGPTVLQAFLTGANPLNPATWLRTALLATPQGYFLTWNPQPGMTYQVQSSSNLAGWSSVGAPRFAAGNTDSVYVGGDNTAFYRILKLY